jgi:hypothetical protein
MSPEEQKIMKEYLSRDKARAKGTSRSAHDPLHQSTLQPRDQQEEATQALVPSHSR